MTKPHENQHYVPQFYQKGFTDGSDPKIWRYVAHGVKPVLQSIEANAAFDNFYAYTDHKGDLDNEKYEKALGVLETTNSQLIYSTVFTEQPLDSNFKEKLGTFLVSQERRTPLYKEKLHESYRELRKDAHELTKLRMLARMFYREKYPYATEAQISSAIAEMEPQLPAMRQKALEDIENVPDEIFPSMATAGNSKGPDALASLNWSIKKAPDTHPFLTSDNPVYRNKGVKLADFKLLFPLSKKYLLEISSDPVTEEYTKLTEDQVEEINQLLVRNAYREVFFAKDSPNLQQLVDQAVTPICSYVVSYKVDTEDGQSELLQVNIGVEAFEKLERIGENENGKQAFLGKLGAVKEAKLKFEQSRKATQ